MSMCQTFFVVGTNTKYEYISARAKHSSRTSGAQHNAHLSYTLAHIRMIRWYTHSQLSLHNETAWRDTKFTKQ